MTEFTWDPPKRMANLAKHGLDLADAGQFDWATATITPGHVDRFGRPRLKAVGWYLGQRAVIVYSELGTEAVAVISFRFASPSERRALDGPETQN